MKQKRNRPVAERFREKYVIEEATGCWEWQLRRDRHGYGRFAIGHPVYLAHRVSYELHKGPIPPGMQIDHLCRNRGCVNPDHLEPVTNHENSLRGAAAITHCPQGHAYTPENTRRAPDGHRFCRACGNAAQRRRYHKRRAQEAATA